MQDKVRKAQDGDLMAFGELVKTFQDAVYGVAYAILGNFHDAQDIAQEAFLQAWRDIGSLKEPAKFPNWLCGITRNRCMDFLRKSKPDIVELEEVKTIHTPLPEPLEQVEKKELAESVLAAVRALPEKLRLTTTLFYINGYTVNEVAEFLEVPTGTVKRRLHDSRKRLKEDIMKDKKMVEIMVGDTLKSFPLPGDFADVVVRMVASAKDLKGLNELMGWSAESVEDTQKDEMFVVEEEGKIESAGQLGEGTWNIGSTVLKAARSNAGIAGEGEGVPDPRFVKGYQGHFKLCKERGIHLALVHGTQYDHGFCGFVPCFYYAIATLAVKKAKSIVTCATLREPYDEKEKEVALDAIARDPYTTKMSASPVRVIEHNGVVGGYITLDANENVGNMTLKTREAARAVIKLMGEKAEEAEEKELIVMQSHKTMITQTVLSLGGKYLLRPSCDVVALDAEMAAIVDLVGLTQDLKDEFRSRLNASPVHDADGSFSIEMSGTTVGFVVKSGSVEIATKKQKTHRILPRWVVTRLYMGYYSGEDVLNMGPIPYDRSDGKTPDDPDLDMKELHLPENEAALFKALFPKLWPCSCPDPDVWPWVIGKEYPHYRHGDEEPPKRKAQIDALRFPWIGY